MIYWEKGKNTFKISENFIISLDLKWDPYTGKGKLLFEGRSSDLLPYEDNIPNFTLQGFII